MIAEEVRKLIEREVAGDYSLINLHGCDLQRCLVPPVMLEYDDCLGGKPIPDPPPIVRLWLGLEECPEDRTGYKIVFGEERGEFGLAIPGTDRDVFLGYYGSFLDTYRGM